jgi:hypothetical protein
VTVKGAASGIHFNERCLRRSSAVQRCRIAPAVSIADSHLPEIPGRNSRFWQRASFLRAVIPCYLARRTPEGDAEARGMCLARGSTTKP